MLQISRLPRKGNVSKSRSHCSSSSTDAVVSLLWEILIRIATTLLIIYRSALKLVPIFYALLQAIVCSYFIYLGSRGFLINQLVISLV